TPAPRARRLVVRTSTAGSIARVTKGRSPGSSNERGPARGSNPSSLLESGPPPAARSCRYGDHASARWLQCAPWLRGDSQAALQDRPSLCLQDLESDW